MSISETLGHYRILRPLGRGGMGEVYVAEDTKLHRKVAIKVLPAALAHDPERRLRFEREAHLIAALNHPNIVTIHSVEEDQGVLFLTMELVEGRPLTEVVTAGGLPLDVLLRVGISVSDAMAAAHHRGITHRDLKPGNIMVTPEGRVKVLDFGLAKLRDAEIQEAADAVTRMPSQDLTGEGRIIGTVAYMSPEQAEGKPVDQRSDIFSLGVVLHELATGEKPFKGETTVSLISSILKDTPPLVTELKPTLPSGISRVIRRSLAKDPERRYQTATDLRNDLEEVKHDVDSGITTSGVVPQPGARGGRSRTVTTVGLAVLMVVLGIVASLGYGYWKRRAAPAVTDRLLIDQPSRLTNVGNAAFAAISPDARYVVHVKNDPGAPSLWMRQASTTSDVQIVPPAAVRYDGVTFSPDGDHVYFVTYGATGGIGTLYKVPVLGGSPQKILEDVDSRIAFSPDRTQFTFLRGVPSEATAYVMLANADGTNVRPLASLEKPDQFTLNGIAWSGDGRTIVTAARSLRGGPHESLVAVDVASGTPMLFGDHWLVVLDLAWVPGTGTFVAAATEPGSAAPQLWQIGFPAGSRRRLTNDVSTYTSVSLSDNGSVLATVHTEAISNLWVTQPDNPAGGVQITRGRGRGDGFNGLDWTPDGQILFVSAASGSPQAWITDSDGREPKQLTGAAQEPVLGVASSADGKYIVFQRVAERRIRIWRMNPDGSDQRPITDGSVDLAPVPAPGGIVYFTRADAGTPRPYKVSIDGGAPELVTDKNFRALDVSPDGAQLLGVAWSEKDRRSVLAIMPASGESIQLLPEIPAVVGNLSADARGVFYPVVERGAVHVKYRDLASGQVRSLGALSEFIFRGALSSDGKRLALAKGVVLSDVLLLSMKRE